MPMIVDPDAPPVEPPATVASPDGWLRAAVDASWAGVVLAVDYTAGTPLAGAVDVRKIRITRQDPGAPAGVPVRGADTAWAVEGVGQAYDHEAPLGVGVTYTCRPQYADGTWGPESSLGIEVTAPAPVADVWIKSLDEPGISARVTVTSWPQLAWESRIDQAPIAGSPFPAASQDVYGAASSDITLDAAGSAIETVRTLLTTPGVRLLQTRPDYRRPDTFVLFGSPAEALDAGPDGSRTFTASVLQVGRPDTQGQRMRMPGWSYDALAEQFATYDAVASSYPTYQSLAVRGLL